jgi:hypothetical protein
MTSPGAAALLEAALDYAARGWSVFPCGIRSKEPAISRGFYSATTNPETIRRRWRLDYNIGVATGMMSKIFVFDVDGVQGAESLRDLESAHGPLRATLTSTTGNGQHLWFRCDSPIPSSVGRIGRSLDVRAEGGYVLAPPSIHPDGPVYRWTSTVPLAAAPAWLVQLAQKPKPIIVEYRKHAGPPDAYGRAALDREISALAQVPPGSRNHALNRTSFVLHQLVAGGELDGGLVHNRLLDAVKANGLLADDGSRQVVATIRSGARAGLRQPRSRDRR